MCLELLKSLMRIQPRIEIIQPNNESDRDAAIGHVVNESAAEFFIAQWPTHRVNHAAAGLLFLWDVPDFFHSDCVDLWIPVSIEMECLDQLLGQGTARTLSQNRDLLPDVNAGFEVAFLVALLVDAFTACLHAGAFPVVDKQFCTGKPCENIHTAVLDLLAKPTGEFVQ